MLCPHLLLILIMLGLIDRNHTCLDAKAGGGAVRDWGGLAPTGALSRAPSRRLPHRRGPWNDVTTVSLIRTVTY